MNISKGDVVKIAKKHLVFCGTEAEDALWFVWEILAGEYDTVKENEQHATNYLRQLEHAMHVITSIESDVIDAIGEAEEGGVI